MRCFFQTVRESLRTLELLLIDAKQFEKQEKKTSKWHDFAHQCNKVNSKRNLKLKSYRCKSTEMLGFCLPLFIKLSPKLQIHLPTPPGKGCWNNKNGFSGLSLLRVSSKYQRQKNRKEKTHAAFLVELMCVKSSFRIWCLPKTNFNSQGKSQDTVPLAVCPLIKVTAPSEFYSPSPWHLWEKIGLPWGYSMCKVPLGTVPMQYVVCSYFNSFLTVEAIYQAIL